MIIDKEMPGLCFYLSKGVQAYLDANNTGIAKTFLDMGLMAMAEYLKDATGIEYDDTHVQIDVKKLNAIAMTKL